MGAGHLPREWTKEEWERHRAVYAAHLLVDPDHTPTRDVLALCDAKIERLSS